MSLIKVLIVDDERSARQELKRALREYPQLEIIGEATNADEAEPLINALGPDLIFLDIHMPERSGFDLLQEISPVPDVVFVTAFDQHALQAFEFNAFDYLVKPFREERLARTINKILKRYEYGTENKRRIFIKEGDKCFFLNLGDIHLIESMDNYAKLFFDGKCTILKSSLNQLEQKLDGAGFFRANRSQIFNINFVNNINYQSETKLILSLSTGDVILLSERQTQKFKRLNSLK